MVAPVSAVPGQTVALDPSLLINDTKGSTAASGLDKEAFLRLLVAQLKYQDPMNPSSNEQFIATTAQFTTIEKLDELATQTAFTSQVNALATASALIGKQVSVVGPDGDLQVTTVLRGEFAAGQLTLQTELGPIGLDQVVALSAPPPAATPAPAATAPTTSPTNPTDPSSDDPDNSNRTTESTPS